MNIRKEAFETILKVFKNNEFSDNLLHQKAKKLHDTDSGLALFYNLVKGIIKYRLKLDYIISQYTDKLKYDKTDIRIKILLYMGLYQLIYLDSIPDHASLNETVELTKELFGSSTADFVNAVLRSYQRDPVIKYPENQIERIAYEYSYPPELIKKWIELWGEEKTELYCIYFNDPPKLHLRANNFATTADKLYNYFAKRGIPCIKSPYSSNILITEKGEEALNEVAFSEGYFSVQDTSAALVVELLDPQPNESILDFFAAPGGKCTYIAEKMQNTGEVIAIDKMPARMKLLKQATERLQLTNIKQVVSDVFNFGPVAAAYDRVLVDAPCSGWGVFGRKADLRWQLHQNMDELLKLQEKALSYAANFVKPKGVLVYSTCTMNPAENEEQIKNFLKRNTNFSLVNADSLINAELCDNGFFHPIPYLHEMDGAFAAKLIRKA